jgi:hypothetical protein
VHSHISCGGKIMVDCGLSTLLLEHANEGDSRLRTAVQVHSNPCVQNRTSNADGRRSRSEEYHAEQLR